MVVTGSQSHILMNQLSNISNNQQIQMAAPVVNYVLSPFEGEINPENPQGLILYLQEKNKIDKEADKLDISVSNAIKTIDHFLSLANKYGWGHLESMVENFVGPSKMF